MKLTIDDVGHHLTDEETGRPARRGHNGHVQVCYRVGQHQSEKTVLIIENKHCIFNKTSTLSSVACLSKWPTAPN